MESIKIKKINLRNSYSIQVTDTEEHCLNIELLKTGMAPVFESKLLILTNAINIEDQLQNIITQYFFGRGDELRDKRDAFINQIMKSSWCTFSAKRSLVGHLANDVIDSKTKDEYNRLISKVISYRNAFAHGELTIVTTGHVKLSWFEGTNRDQFLTDEYFEGIEEHFKRCVDILDKISYKLGMNNRASYTVTIYGQKFDNTFPVKFWYDEDLKTCTLSLNNGTGSEKGGVTSIHELLDYVGSTTSKIWKDQSWTYIRNEIVKLVKSACRHFVIGSNSKIIDHY